MSPSVSGTTGAFFVAAVSARHSCGGLLECLAGTVRFAISRSRTTHTDECSFTPKWRFSSLRGKCCNCHFSYGEGYHEHRDQSQFGCNSCKKRMDVSRKAGCKTLKEYEAKRKEAEDEAKRKATVAALSCPSSRHQRCSAAGEDGGQAQVPKCRRPRSDRRH